MIQNSSDSDLKLPVPSKLPKTPTWDPNDWSLYFAAQSGPQLLEAGIDACGEDLATSQRDLRNEFEDRTQSVASPSQMETAPFVMSLQERYTQGQRKKSGYIAYVVFAGRSTGVYYNWNAVNRATENLNFNDACFKGFKTYEGACTAWKRFIENAELPADTIATLARLRRLHPVPPIFVDPLVGGMPLHISSAVTTTNTSRLAVPIHANATNTPLRRQTSNTSHLQSQSHARHNTHSSQPLNRSSPDPPPYSIMPATPSIQHHTIPQFQLLSSTPSSAGPSTLSSVQTAVTPTDHHVYWVVFLGRAPGVYIGRQRGRAARGPSSSAKYVTACTEAEANALFVDAYMRGEIGHLSE